MANHLTPEELSKELGIDRDEVIRVCVEEGVPIYQGKIDKTLFQAQLEALGAVAQPALSAEEPGVGSDYFAAARFFGRGLLARGRFAPSSAPPLRRATLRFSASIRSTTGASATGSGSTISSPCELRLEHRAQVSRYSLWSSAGSNSPTRLVDHLARELELRLLDLGLRDRLVDLGLRA